MEGKDYLKTCAMFGSVYQKIQERTEKTNRYYDDAIKFLESRLEDNKLDGTPMIKVSEELRWFAGKAFEENPQDAPMISDAINLLAKKMAEEFSKAKENGGIADD